MVLCVNLLKRSTEYVLPSDITALPKSQIRGNVNSVKMKKVKDSSKMVTSLPPIGGVVSNYVLLRNQPNYQNLLRLPLSSMKKNDAYQTKRETFDEDDDSVVVVAEPLKSSKNNEKQIKRKEEEEEGEEGEGEEMTKNDEREEGDEKQELQPSIAQVPYFRTSSPPLPSPSPSSPPSPSPLKL